MNGDEPPDIWGDEVNFIERVKAAGHEVGTVTRAIHQHPTNKKKPYRLFGRYVVSETDDKRLPIFLRNYSYNLWHYKGVRPWALFSAKQLAYEVFVKKSPSRLFTALGALANGLFVFPGKVTEGVKKTYTPPLGTSRDWNDSVKRAVNDV